jgi:hypothetical protein
MKHNKPAYLISWTNLASIATLLILTACGGGGGDSTTQPPPPLVVPSSVNAPTFGVKTATSVVINWTGVSDATSYKIYRDVTNVGTVSASSTTFTDVGLNTANSYNYSVQACGTGGCANLSNFTSVFMRYQKISGAGLTLSDSAVQGVGASDWTCTKDLSNGLMWELKTTANVNDLLTNYDSAAFGANQKTICSDWFFCMTKTISSATQAEIDATTNSVGYATVKNTANFCGFSDWRWPTASELLTIKDSTVASGQPYINAAWFPNTTGADYISSTPLSDTLTSISKTSNILFAAYCCGVNPVGLGARSNGYRLRLVRTAP